MLVVTATVDRRLVVDARRGERANVDASIISAETEIDRLKGVAKLVEYAAARKAELAERLNLIERLRATERDPVTLLETVNKSMPDGLWLLDLKQTGNKFQIEGQALSLTYVTAFSEQLQDSGFFVRPVEIVNTKTEMVQDTSVVRFVLKAAGHRQNAATVAKPAASPCRVPTRGRACEGSRRWLRASINSRRNRRWSCSACWPS